MAENALELYIGGKSRRSRTLHSSGPVSIRRLPRCVDGYGCRRMCAPYVDRGAFNIVGPSSCEPPRGLTPGLNQAKHPWTMVFVR
jgi:hypothetical protein